ncbi:MAG TPA: signal peptidase I [Pyrinomonadaceae bacterium]|nr:signal peptidase I [Pyrinomonadaceae bacterium]
MFGLKKSRRAPRFGSITAEDDPDIEVQRPHLAARHSFWAESRLLLRDLIVVLMATALMVVFIVQPVKVEGTSMLPRLHDGERIFVNKLIYYGMPRLERGDIVVFWYPNDPSKSYIKRVVGLPGETVEVREGRVMINGKVLEEPYLDPQLNLSHMNHQPVLVKDHYYFVMGDNRDHSSDSRFWGLVPEKYIYGKALFRYWPLGSASIITHDPAYESAPQQPQPSADAPQTLEQPNANEDQ